MVAALATALLRLYPREWRRRYGGEMTAMLEDQRLTPRVAADLLAGAIDARLNPHWRPARVPAFDKGVTMTTGVFRCAPASVSREDQWRSAGWLIAGTILLTAVSLTTQAVWGDNALSEALLYGAFPASLMLSNECTFLRPYSKAARITMAGGGAVLILLLMWASVLIGNRI